ncbi:MAG: hypothetical protein JNK58_00565 [Phycisphaerae bacterium]|nr:hypothetical protein [Phycisphaerae bacterium]
MLAQSSKHATRFGGDDSSGDKQVTCRALYREWWEKRLAEHEAAVWRVRNGVE